MENVSVTTLRAALGQGGDTVDFIDVRSPDEYRQQHVPGVRNVPLPTITHRLAEFRDKATIFVMCRSGGRSKIAAQSLQLAGVEALIFNVDGGVQDWMRAGYETVLEL